MAATAAPSTLAEWCEAHRYRSAGILAGGSLSDVIAATGPHGRRVVVKFDPGGAVRSEAAWLARHAHAPEVLDVDADAGVIVLSHVDGTILRTHPAPIDVPAELAWVERCAAASGPPAGDEPVVADLFYAAVAGILARGPHDSWESDLAQDWVAWLDSVDRAGWRSVAFDVIPKNTLVSGDGTWTAIDPMCVIGPDELVGGSWGLNRAMWFTGRRYSPDVRAGDRDWPAARAEVLDIQERFVAAAPDPAVATTWAAGFSLWRLASAKPGTGRHDMYRVGADHWLRRWATGT